MANSILVLGFTGQGKSSSLFNNEEAGIKGLDPKETFIISVTNKPLPFRGWKKHYTLYSKENPTGNLFYSDKPDIIIRLINNIVSTRKDIKNIIIDDFHYLMVEDNMNRINEKGFEKFNIMSKNLFDLIKLTYSIPQDINFIYMGHPEIEEGRYKLKTIGKLIDKSVTPEGYFTYLFCSSVEYNDDGSPVYGFYTNNTIDFKTGNKIIAKTPVGLFKDLIIKNDMGYIIEEIEKYNNGE